MTGNNISGPFHYYGFLMGVCFKLMLLIEWLLKWKKGEKREKEETVVELKKLHLFKVKRQFSVIMSNSPAEEKDDTNKNLATVINYFLLPG